METINDEIAKVEATSSTLEYQIEKALRKAVPQYLFLGSSDDTTTSSWGDRPTVSGPQLL